MRNLLFLCTGNYYRSRFAESLFNHLVPADSEWRATSRGLAREFPRSNVGAVSKYALRALRQRGVAMAEPMREPARVSDADFEASDRIIALEEREHRPMLLEWYPGWAPRVEYWDVPDVRDMSPVEALGRIEERVRALLAELTPSKQPRCT